MYNITSVNSLKLLPKLMELAEFDTGEVTLSTGIRSQLQKELGLAPATFTRAINDLIENNALQKVFIEEEDKETGEITKTEVKGQYLINPEMF
jgi:DNA-binding MarR family transcriptional regulator